MIFESKKGGFTKITQPQVVPHLEPCEGDQSPCLRRGLGVVKLVNADKVRNVGLKKQDALISSVILYVST